MSILLSDENEDYFNDDKNRINKFYIEPPKTTKLVKYFRGIYIYFKDYILFLKGNVIKIFRMMNYATYHWGFQMIMAIGMMQSYGAVNIMAMNFAPNLVKEGEIE